MMKRLLTLVVSCAVVLTAFAGKSGKVVIRNVGLMLSGDIDQPILDADTIVVNDGVGSNLGQSGLNVTPICLGTMTFGEQVDEPTAHAILDRSLERGVDFIDTAEMYAVPARAETCGATETIIGNWFAKNPGARGKLVLATKVAGPSRGMPWVREGGYEKWAGRLKDPANRAKVAAEMKAVYPVARPPVERPERWSRPAMR